MKTLTSFLRNPLSSLISSNLWTSTREFNSKMHTYYVKEMIFVSTYKKTAKRLAVYSSLFFLAIIVASIPHLLCKSVRLHRNMRFKTDLKYILFYNESHTPQKDKKHHRVDKDVFATGQKLFIKQKCPNINCFITYDKDLLPQDGDFDAVVFNMKNLKHVSLRDINLSRTPHQKYVFRSLEASEHHPLCHDDYDDFFNWTWTYKLNSDLPHPFMNVYDGNNNIVGPKKNMSWKIDMEHNKQLYRDKIRTKKKAVACIIDKCKIKSKHKDFLLDFQKELKGYNFTIDTYGACGKQQCPGTGKACYEMIEKDYYFQLVLEDSNSEDYLTDKIVRVMSHATIPIVIGDIDYNNFLPPGSYLNTRFLSMKELGAVISHLIKNISVYEYFFDWKSYYHFKPIPSNFVCDLCEKLNDVQSVSERKGYQNLREWWYPGYKDTCERIRLYNYFTKDYL